MNSIIFRKYCFSAVHFLVSLLSLESFRQLSADNHGGLVLPFSGEAINDEEWLEYQKLDADQTATSINPYDLPSDFCEEACRVVDEFHKKTVNEKVEWMLYFDYLTGEVIYCWKGDVGKSGGDYKKENFNERHIASIHSHAFGYYSFPSPDNFDILENQFEDYEIITSTNAFWIVEFKGVVDKAAREIFQINMVIELNRIEKYINQLYTNRVTIRNMIERVVSEYLLRCADKNIGNIKLGLIKKELK